MLTAVWFTLPTSAPQLGLLRQGDWLGIALMGVGLAAFQTVLDDDNVYNWFDSPFTVKLSLVAALALGAFVLWQFITPAPLVKFKLFGRRNFGFGTLGNFLLGFALYGSAYLLPQYLAVAQGFDAEQIGEVVAWTGLLVIPLVPLLMKRIDFRLLVGVGLVVFAAICFMNLWLDQDYATPQLFWPNVIRALRQAIVMTPISGNRLGPDCAERGGAASGLFNMMRNLGGAIGTAAVETFFTHREQFHSAMITPQVSLVDLGDARPARRSSALFRGARLPRSCRRDAPRDHRRRPAHPYSGYDHGLRRQLRADRSRVAACRVSGHDAARGRCSRRGGALNLA